MARNNTPVDKNSREYLLRQVANGRYSLLLIVILTVVNLIMTILDTNTYFLFSASVPYYLVFVGMGIENGFVNGAWNVKGTLTYTGLVIALVIVAVYLLCWLLSKKRAGWLTAALVLFIIDTVALVVIAIAIPQFVSLLLISRALEPAGAVNVLLQELGLISAPLPFLLDPTLARIVVVVVNMWIGIPYTMMTFSGVLMNIPAELYESAEMDGAGPVRRFISITLPYMFFVTAPATITTFVTNFNNFNVIYLLTAGGPFSLDYYQAGKTDLLVTWLYKLTVNRNDYSLASTIGIFIFMLVGSCSLLVYNRTGAVKKEDQFQ